MERKETMLKTGCSRIFWAVMAILLCAVPALGADLDIPNDGTEYNIPGDFGPTISGSLWVYGKVNLLPGSLIEGIVVATATSVVNITGGTVVLWIDVAAEAKVTIYGTNFKVDGVDVSGTIPINGLLTGVYGDGVTEFAVLIDCQPNATVTLAPPGGTEPLEVDIDIKPGSYPNPINQGSNGIIPVAILTTDTFNAADVDPGTVTLNEATVAVRGKSLKLMARLEDVDGDGDDDLMLQVETESWADLGEDGEVTLSGETYEGQAIEGKDYVVIVPPLPE